MSSPAGTLFLNQQQTVFSVLSFLLERVYGEDLKPGEGIFLRRWRGNRALLVWSALGKTSLTVQQSKLTNPGLHRTFHLSKPRLELCAGGRRPWLLCPALACLPTLMEAQCTCLPPALCNHSNIAAAFIPLSHTPSRPRSGAGS